MPPPIVTRRSDHGGASEATTTRAQTVASASGTTSVWVAAQPANASTTASGIPTLRRNAQTRLTARPIRSARKCTIDSGVSHPVTTEGPSRKPSGP